MLFFMRRSSRHHQSKLLFVRFASAHAADYLTFEYNVYPVRKAHYLVQFKAYQ